MFPLGIDLGTCQSAVSKWTSRTAFTGSEPYVIPLEGKPTLPSKVFFDELDGVVSVVVGGAAARAGIRGPDRLIQAVKRKMDDRNFEYEVLGRSYGPIDVSAEILKTLLKTVDGVEGPGTFVPEGVVVTVPHYFKHHQNVNTQDAALAAIRETYSGRQIPGDVDDLMLGLVAEPIAAGLDYAFARGCDGKENVLVLDLGGGTFDVTVITIDQVGTRIFFKVQAIDGDDRLGGEDFDRSFLRWLCEAEGLNLDGMGEKERAMALYQLVPAVSEAKEVLSTTKRTEIALANVVAGRNVEREIRRAEFEACITGRAGDGRDYFSEVESKLEKVLNKAGMEPDDVTWVLLTGGSSRIPLFRDLVEQKFGLSKCKLAGDIDLAVTRGAAIYAAHLLDERLEEAGKPRKHLDLWDRIEIEEPTAHELGFVLDGRFNGFIRDNEPTPKSKTRLFEPTILSPDGSKARLGKIPIAQGTRDDFSIVGDIALEDIHTHGRALDDISVNARFTAHRNLVTVRVEVDKGNADGSRFVREEVLRLGEDSTPDS